MDRNLALAGVSVVLAGMLGFTWAQGRGGVNADEHKPLTQDVAVVDVGKVFEKHKRFMDKSADFRRANEHAQDKLRALNVAGQKLAEELRQQKPGSADFARIQSEFAEKKAEYDKYAKEQAERFQKEQAEAISVTYKEIEEEIQRIAEARGLRLVLRFQTELPDAKNPMKLGELVNRQVLYQSGLDITEDVAQAFN